MESSKVLLQHTVNYNLVILHLHFVLLVPFIPITFQRLQVVPLYNHGEQFHKPLVVSLGPLQNKNNIQFPVYKDIIILSIIEEWTTI